LKEAPQQPLMKKALILSAMSQGVWFTTVDDIKIS